MFETGLPVGVGVHQVELVGTFEMFVRMLLDQTAAVDGRSGNHQIGASLVESYGVERGQDTQVGHDGGIVVVPAIALGRYVHDEADVEVGFILQDGLGILGNLVVEPFRGIAFAHDGRIVLAQGYALSATYAFVVVDYGLVVGIEVYGIVGTVFHAYVAAFAVVNIDARLRIAVQLQFAAYAGTTHTQVFQGAAESGLLVALEVSHRDDDVGIGQSRPDFRSFAIFAIQGYFAVFGSFQAIGNNHLALGRDGVIAVFHGALQVIYRIGSPARVECIAVGEERLGSPRTEQIGQSGGIVGPQVGQVARLPEVDFYSYKLVFEIDGLDAGPFD